MLAKARKAKGLSHRQLAERIGLPREKAELAALYELGNEVPDWGMLTPLCIVLGLDYFEIGRLIARCDVEERVDDEEFLLRRARGAEPRWKSGPSGFAPHRAIEDTA